MSGRGGELALVKRNRRMSWEAKSGVFFQLSHNIWWVSASNLG